MFSKMIVLATAGILFSTALTFASLKEQEKIQGSTASKNINPSDYPNTAKIDLKEAIGIATKKVPGRMISIALEDEDGFLVYAVKIASANSGAHEVLVDAGNGKVLADQKKVLSAKLFSEEDEEESKDDQD